MKRILLSAIALVALASCTKSESNSVETTDLWSGELRISSGIATRASGTTWEAADSIGVFMNLTTGGTAVGEANTKYVTTDNTGTAAFKVYTDETGVTKSFVDLYYPQSGTVDIVAHYPYSDDSDVTASTYPVDVQTQTDLTAIDFMSAKMVGVSKNKNALELEFYHMLSKLEITLAASGGLTEAELEGATVTVSGTKPTAKATISSTTNTTTNKEDLSAGFTFEGDAANLSVKAASGSRATTFILVPQSVGVTITIKLTDDREFFTSETTLAFLSGYEYEYTVNVSKTVATISGATINLWGDGTEGNSGSLNASDL